MQYRFAQPHDAPLLASLNAQLIRDEGHRNSMTIEQLADRMSRWLAREYEAVIFHSMEVVVGYALYCRASEYVYLRQLFVAPEHRRRGYGRRAIDWLWANAWSDTKRLRIDVLVGNETGQAFWLAMGFSPYCITMEMPPPN